MLKKGGSGKIEFPGGAILSSGGANFDPGGANFDPGGANAGLPHPILRPCFDGRNIKRSEGMEKIFLFIINEPTS